MDDVYDKEDYGEMLKEFSDPVVYATSKNIATSGKFIFNDPNLFAQTYANMIRKEFGGTGKEKTFVELFLETPLDEQEKYLISQGKIVEVPVCLFRT